MRRKVFLTGNTLEFGGSNTIFFLIFFLGLWYDKGATDRQWYSGVLLRFTASRAGFLVHMTCCRLVPSSYRNSFPM